MSSTLGRKQSASHPTTSPNSSPLPFQMTSCLIPATQEAAMHTAQLISQRIYVFLAHTTTQEQPCPHLEEPQITFAAAHTEAADLAAWAWPDFMVQVDDNSRKTEPNHCFLKTPTLSQRMGWERACRARPVDCMRFPVVGPRGSEFSRDERSTGEPALPRQPNPSHRSSAAIWSFLDPSRSHPPPHLPPASSRAPPPPRKQLSPAQLRHRSRSQNRKTIHR